MAAESYPFDDMPSYIDNECYTAQDDRRRQGSLVCGEGVETFAGLRVTESAVPAMTVLVSAGGGWVANDEGTCEGPYYAHMCDAQTVVIDANTSGSTRFDTIWLRACDSQYSAAGSGGSIYYDPGGATSTDPTTAVVPTDDCSYYLLAIIQVTDGETTINGTPDGFGLTETDVTDTRGHSHLCGTADVYKPVDESVTSSTTLQDDNHLFFTVPAGTQMRFDGFLNIDGGAGDFKYTFTGTGTVTGAWTTSAGNAALALGVTAPFTPVPVTRGAVGTVNGGASGGTLKLQWAQNSSSGTATTLKAGSWLSAQRLG